jgi:hypothetical protein
MNEVAVYDGGPDGAAATQEGNALFMAQGIFIP